MLLVSFQGSLWVFTIQSQTLITEHAGFCEVETHFMVLTAFGKFIHGTLRSLLQHINKNCRKN